MECTAQLSQKGNMKKTVLGAAGAMLVLCATSVHSNLVTMATRWSPSSFSLESFGGAAEASFEDGSAYWQVRSGGERRSTALPLSAAAKETALSPDWTGGISFEESSDLVRFQSVGLRGAVTDSPFSQRGDPALAVSVRRLGKGVAEPTGSSAPANRRVVATTPSAYVAGLLLLLPFALTTLRILRRRRASL